MYPINVKTAKRIGPNIFVGPHITSGKVYGWSNFQKFASNNKKIVFLLWSLNPQVTLIELPKLKIIIHSAITTFLIRDRFRGYCCESGMAPFYLKEQYTDPFIIKILPGLNWNLLETNFLGNQWKNTKKRRISIKILIVNVWRYFI